jgi:hypothetical protein
MEVILLILWILVLQALDLLIQLSVDSRQFFLLLQRCFSLTGYFIIIFLYDLSIKCLHFIDFVLQRVSQSFVSDGDLLLSLLLGLSELQILLELRYLLKMLLTLKFCFSIELISLGLMGLLLLLSLSVNFFLQLSKLLVFFIYELLAALLNKHNFTLFLSLQLLDLGSQELYLLFVALTLLLNFRFTLSLEVKDCLLILLL